MIHFRIWQLGRQEQRDLLQKMHICEPVLQKLAFFSVEIQLTIANKQTGHLALQNIDQFCLKVLAELEIYMSSFNFIINQIEHNNRKLIWLYNLYHWWAK